LESNLDGVDIWIRGEESKKCISNPGRCAVRYCYEGNEKWQTPELSTCTNIKATIQFLAQPCPKQELK
jgi:hypothetical protein